MFTWFYELKRSLYNIWYWFPIIWKDRDWDSCYILEILKHKLKKHKKWLLSGKAMPYVGIEKDVCNINTCILLLDRLERDDYDDMLERKLKMQVTKHGRLDIIVTKEGKTLGLCSDPHKYGYYLRKQDMKLFCNILNKQLLNWWD